MTKYRNSWTTFAALSCCVGAVGFFVGCEGKQTDQIAPSIRGQRMPTNDHRQGEHSADSDSGNQVGSHFRPDSDLKTAMPNPGTNLGLIGTWRQILLNDAGKRFITEEEFLEWDSKCTITNQNIIWKSGVRQNVSVFSYKLDQTTSPQRIDWMVNGRTVKGILKIDGDLLNICIGSKRPLDFDPAGSPSENLFVFRRTNAPPVEAKSADNVQLENAFADFEAAALSGDQAAIEQAILQYQNVRSSDKTERFVQLLNHSDSTVRVETVRLFGRPEPGYGKVMIPGPALVQMLTMLDDKKLSVAVRCEIVTILLQGYEGDRQPLYAKLRDMGADGHFAVPALASFISDKQHRHWSAGGGFDAPVGAVELLDSWGAGAEEAVPDLIIALRHSNQWKFVPAVATALGAIGPKAKPAIPGLRRCLKSSDSNLRTAASKSLEKISGKDGNN